MYLVKLMLLVIAILFVATACTERKAEVPPPTVEELRRNDDIRHIRVILGFESGESASNPILANLKSGKLSLFGKVCKDLQLYRDLTWVVSRLEGKPHIEVSEVHPTLINPKQVKVASVEAGTEAVRGLIEVLKQPLPVRAEVGSCRHSESPYTYGESDRIVEDMTRILHGIGLKLEDVKTSRQAIRDVLLKDFRARIAEIRARIKRGEASTSDGGGMLIGIAVDAISWGFSPEELQLTKEETADVAYLAKPGG